MEAKGCAKRMECTNARRHFYWAVRGRVARSSALNKLAEADPSLTHDQRREILEDSLSLDSGASPQAVAEAYEAVDLKRMVPKLKNEYLLSELLALAGSTFSTPEDVLFPSILSVIVFSELAPCVNDKFLAGGCADTMSLGSEYARSPFLQRHPRNSFSRHQTRDRPYSY
jgi:hypothetical protein